MNLLRPVAPLGFSKEKTGKPPQYLQFWLSYGLIFVLPGRKWQLN